MARFQCILILLIGTLIFSACKSSSTKSGGGGSQSVEPSAKIKNPADGSTLERKISFSVDGESQNGFDEARLYVGRKKIQTLTNPSLPISKTIKTYLHDNGFSSLRVQLDPSSKDTTVEDSVSVEWENYLVTLQTDQYIQNLKDKNDAVYLFIADPQGKVLREMELTAKTDGTFKLLPPSSFNGDAPDYYTYTLGYKFVDDDGNNKFNLSTDAGLESWETIHKKYTDSDNASPSSKDLTVKLNNFAQTPFETTFNFEDYPHYQGSTGHTYNPGLTKNIEIPDGSKYLTILQLQNQGSPKPPQAYKLLENPESLPQSVSYDVSSDFKKMEIHAVDEPSGIEIYAYTNWMTNAKDSFEAEGDMVFSDGNQDANGNDPGYGIWVPKNITDHSFFTSMNAKDKSNSDISYLDQSAVSHDFVDKFHKVDAEVTFNDKSLDNMDIDISGSTDYMVFNSSTGKKGQVWDVTVPDTTSQVVFPEIADSLNQSVMNYNRSNFQLTGLSSFDVGQYNGYAGYLKDEFGTKDFDTVIEFSRKDRTINSSSQPKTRTKYNRLRGYKNQANR